MAVEQRRDRAGVGDDPGDVRRRREAADLERAVGVCGRAPPRGRPRSMWPSASSSIDHDVGDRLAPRQLVGVVLVRADEHDRPLARRDLPAQVVALVEVGREAQVETSMSLLIGAGRARAAEDDDVVVGAADRVADDPPRVLAEAGGLEAGARGLGVGVGVERQHLASRMKSSMNVERSARRGVVGVGDAARARTGPSTASSSPMTPSRMGSMSAAGWSMGAYRSRRPE